MKGQDAATDESPDRRERTRERHRQAILQAAAAAFARHGYERASMQQIAQAADFSVGKLYYHFEGKEAIYRALMQANFRTMAQLSNLAVDKSEPPLEQLRVRIEAALGHLSTQPAFTRLYTQENPLHLAGMLKREQEQNILIISDLLGKAMRRGDLVAQEPRLLAAIYYGALRQLIKEISGRDTEHELPGIVDLLHRIILQPLVRPAP